MESKKLENGKWATNCVKTLTPTLSICTGEKTCMVMGNITINTNVHMMVHKDGGKVSYVTAVALPVINALCQDCIAWENKAAKYINYFYEKTFPNSFFYPMTRCAITIILC